MISRIPSYGFSFLDVKEKTQAYAPDIILSGSLLHQDNTN